MAKSEPLRVVADQARAVAMSVLKHPVLYSVLVDPVETNSDPKPFRLRFGFQEILEGLLMGTRLKTCWVDVCLEPRSLAIGPVGTFGRKQFRELAALKGSRFPPARLELEELRLEITDVLRALAEHPVPGAVADLGTVHLSLFHHEGHLTWRAIQDVAGVAIRTLFLDAGDGDVLFEKVDQCESD